MIHQERFASELALNPDSPSVLALSYAIGLVSAAVSPQYSDHVEACYTQTRRYLEVCEVDDEAVGSLNVFQALLLVLRYEIMGNRATRGWITIGRATRLAHVLNLHKIDRRDMQKNVVNGLHIELPPTDDPTVIEERRRSFWTLFILETYIVTRTGMEYQLGSPNVSLQFLIRLRFL